jgi:hypothetical protein
VTRWLRNRISFLNDQSLLSLNIDTFFGYCFGFFSWVDCFLLAFNLITGHVLVSRFFGIYYGILRMKLVMN